MLCRLGHRHRRYAGWRRAIADHSASNGLRKEEAKGYPCELNFDLRCVISTRDALILILMVVEVKLLRISDA